MTDTKNSCYRAHYKVCEKQTVVKHQVVMERFLDNLSIIPVNAIRRKCILMHTGNVWVVSIFLIQLNIIRYSKLIFNSFFESPECH